MNRLMIAGLGGSRRGASMLGILIVIAIILIVLAHGPFKRDPVVRTTQIETHIDRSDQVAVAANINSMQTELQMMQLTNPERRFTIDEIRQRLHPAPSRSGGEYLLGPDGRIYHSGYPDLAPPAEMMEQMISLEPQGM